MHQIVTIMGHVDHGKNNLLDTLVTHVLRLEKLVNITQHIGAYQVKRLSISAFLDMDTQPLHLCVPVVLLLQILLS